ncbi:MAG: hypothetical protein CMJ81_15090 [Planctomycetaceae bacterium]|jgi:hypothetical protein|nr:hypothetical protein [Planctomycetaceae bacterium]MBP62092.1 hypothetical protein [Planctomycetaceae bacterium]
MTWYQSRKCAGCQHGDGQRFASVIQPKLPTREIAWKRLFSEATRPPIYCRPSALVLALAIQRPNDSKKDNVIWAILVILNRLVAEHIC